MAERRMFAKSIIESDLFLDMPTSARLLYFDLGMRGDDDGFVDSPKRIMRVTGSSDDDLKLPIAKRFLIPFESGVIVVRHWKIHNLVRSDRYKPTQYQHEKSLLTDGINGTYCLRLTDGIPNDNQVETDGIPVGIPNGNPHGCIGEVRLGKVSIGEEKGCGEKPQPSPPEKEPRKRGRAKSTKRPSSSYDLAAIEASLEKGE